MFTILFRKRLRDSQNLCDSSGLLSDLLQTWDLEILPIGVSQVAHYRKIVRPELAVTHICCGLR